MEIKIDDGEAYLASGIVVDDETMVKIVTANDEFTKEAFCTIFNGAILRLDENLVVIGERHVDEMFG